MTAQFTPPTNILVPTDFSDNAEAALRYGASWAARVGDEVYPMRGTALPTEEQLPAHGPEGMCTMERTAVVDGQVHGGLLMVESFQLLPADPDARRADPHQHEHEAR